MMQQGLLVLLLGALLLLVSSLSIAQDLPSETGKAAWYGKKFDGRTTASGERFDSSKLIAAHPSLPFGSTVRVTNLKNDKSVELRIVDRGPSRAVRARGFVVDVSLQAAKALGFVKQGLTDVRVDVLSIK